MVKSVFISSTSLDLPDHRAAVDKAIRRLGLRPINMDDFGSQPGGASGVSVREVGNADIFVGLIARRYGYVPDGMDKSVTEQEYDEAVRRRVPRLMYLLDPAADWPEDRVEANAAAQEKLAAFRARIEKNEVRSLFRTPEDLAAQVTADLTKALDNSKQGQWYTRIAAVLIALLILVGLVLFAAPEVRTPLLVSLNVITETYTPTITPTPTMTYTPTITPSPTNTLTPLPTALEGKPAESDEIVVVVAQFERTGTEREQEINMLEVMQDAARQVGNVRVIAIGHPIHGREEAQTVSDVYNATMVVYGRSEPGGVRSSYEITPRFSEVGIEVEGDFRISSAEIDNFDAFLFDGMDSSYILGLTAGQLYFWQNDYESAIRLLSFAANGLRVGRETELEAYILYFMRANAYIQLKDFESALADFSEAIRLKTDSPELYISRGIVHYLLGNLDEAVADQNRGIELDPDYLVAYIGRGMALTGLGDLDAAIADFNHVIELDPNDPQVYIGRGLARADLGDLDGAIADFSHVIELDPSDAEAFSNRAAIKLELDDLEGGLADLDRAIELDPTYANSYYNRGVLRDDLGDLDGAIADYTRAIELRHSDLYRVYSNRAVTQTKLGDLDSALDDINQAIELKPDNATVYFNRAIIYDDQGNVDAAIADYTRAIELDSTYATAYYRRGRIYNSQGELNRALDDFNRSIDLCTVDCHLDYFFRGITYRDQGNVDDAIADFTQALELNPQFEQAYYFRGEIYYQQGELDAALDDFNHSIEWCQTACEADYFSRALVRTGQGDLDGAIADYAQAVSLNPDYADAYWNRGLLYYQQNNFEAALADFTHLVELVPDNAEYHLVRGGTYLQLGRINEAAADYWLWVSSGQTQITTLDDFQLGESQTLEIHTGWVYSIPFTGEEGQIVTALADADSTSLDALLILLDADGNPIFVSDDISTENFNAAITDFNLPEDGMYTLIVSHSGGGSEGQITLSLDVKDAELTPEATDKP